MVMKLHSYFSLSESPVCGENMIWFIGWGKVTVVPAIGGGTLAFLKEVIKMLPETYKMYTNFIYLTALTRVNIKIEGKK